MVGRGAAMVAAVAAMAEGGRRRRAPEEERVVATAMPAGRVVATGSVRRRGTARRSRGGRARA